MTRIAVALSISFFAVAFVWRSTVQHRRTGDWGFRLDRASGPLPRIASALMVAGFLVIFTALVADLSGAVSRVSALDRSALRGLGVAVMAFALIVTARAQLDLRDSWRIGVDPNERTELVTDGLFGVVRNPIFAGMLMFAVGASAVVPSWLAVLGTGAIILGLEVQVRGVEEPYLLHAHGPAYRRYMERVGRFFPAVGRGRVDVRGSRAT